MEENLGYSEYRKLLVKTSWRRCANDFKLERENLNKVAILTANEIRVRQDTIAEYLSKSQEVIEAVRHLAKQGDYCVLISDGAGVAVEDYADTAESSECQAHGLKRGSVWEEHHIGTNGIGTCLAAQNCITISGEEHYSKMLKNFTCTASPIYAVDGSIIGSLNISRMVEDNFIESYFTHSFISEAAKQISANIFLSEFPDQNIICCTNHDNVSLYESKALLAYNDEGVILGATRDCMALLDNIDSDQIIGQKLTDFIPVSVDHILSSQHQYLRVREGLFANKFIKGLRSHMRAAVPSSDFSSSQRKFTKVVAPKIKTAEKIKTVQKTLQKTSKSLLAFAGDDAAVYRAAEIGEKLIDKDIPLLILGETGVGKDTLAKLLHLSSKRASQPFIAVNCASIPPSLMESELFGYKPGTFTDGLKEGKIGKILASDGGTLFLDEIGDMPLTLQAHLLRVLEEREVTPLGAIEPVSVDIRVVCATHKNISELVGEGLFRQDLLFRIKGAEIVLPPLRERTNIKQIAEIIIEKEIAAELGDEETYRPIKISETVWDALEQYSWPGNIRELKSVIKYALCFCSNDRITLEDLPDQLLKDINEAPPVADQLMKTGEKAPLDLKDKFSLQINNSTAEAQLIQSLLKQNGWNITATANKLGISRSTLHRKIRKYKIVSPNKTSKTSKA